MQKRSSGTVRSKLRTHDNSMIGGNGSLPLHLINAPDFVKVAESVGGYGEQVTDRAKLHVAPKRGLEANRSGKPAIIDVIVTYMIR